MGSHTPSSAGNFSYPPPGSSLQFNYIDSLVTSWLTFDPNPTDCLLSVWIWPNASPWIIVFNQSVPANGTSIVPLNFASDGYLGQLNMNYNGTRKFVGAIFHVDNSPQSSAVTWSQGVLAGPTPSASAGLQISISASLLTSSASPATTTTSENPPPVLSLSATSSLTSVSVSPPTKGSGPGTGVIVGIVVGIFGGVALAAAVLFIFYRRRKPNSAPAELRTSSSADFQSPVPAGFIGEKDGSSLRPTELSGDGQLLEMANGDH